MSEPSPPGRRRDPQQVNARATLEAFFDSNRSQVFFSRQLEILHEDRYFHWIVNRALRELAAEGSVRSERRALRTGTSISLYWHRSYRYYRRDARRVASLVEAYAEPALAGGIGYHGEMMVLEGFARSQFVLLGRGVREYAGRRWDASEHDLAFLFARDGLVYGVEVKNALGYMDHGELQTKLELCAHLRVRPVFVVRMMPRTWLLEVTNGGGYGMILKYQLYPPTHRELARRVAEELGLPVDAPRALEEGTMQRFLRWQAQQLCIRLLIHAESFQAFDLSRHQAHLYEYVVSVAALVLASVGVRAWARERMPGVSPVIPHLGGT